LYVDEAMRSQGAGAALMSYLTGVARKNDCTHIAWYTDARNVRGLDFYHRLGAEIRQHNGNRCLLEWMPWTTAENDVGAEQKRGVD
jgi:GNAT superfamily N-acetyltransferase